MVCVKCNIDDGDLPGCVNEEFCDCKDIIDKNSLYRCSKYYRINFVLGSRTLFTGIDSHSNTTHQLDNLYGTTPALAAGRDKREKQPNPEFLVQSLTFNNKNPRGVSLSIFSPKHYNLNSLDVVMHAYTDGVWHGDSRILVSIKLHLNKIIYSCIDYFRIS